MVGREGGETVESVDGMRSPLVGRRDGLEGLDGSDFLSSGECAGYLMTMTVDYID